MNPFFKFLVVEATKRKLKRKAKPLAGFQFAKQVKNTTVEIAHLLHDIPLIMLGILSAGFGLSGFLLPNSFIDGGVTGISLIVAEITGLSLSVLLVAINIPFIILAYRTIGRQFALRSFLAILVLALTVHYFPFPLITDDKLLISVFGGFFLGLGSGLAIRGGAVIDGTEVAAVFVSRKTHITIGDVILVFNIVIFGFAAYIFSLEIALYAILTYLVASRTVDYVVSGIEEYVGVTIISEKSEAIRVAIIEHMGRGCTLYKGKRGFAKEGEPLKDTDIVYTLLTRLELAKLYTEIDKIDKNAFLVMHSIKDAKGGMIKKRPLK